MNYVVGLILLFVGTYAGSYGFLETFLQYNDWPHGLAPCVAFLGSGAFAAGLFDLREALKENMKP